MQGAVATQITKKRVGDVEKQHCRHLQRYHTAFSRFELSARSQLMLKRMMTKGNEFYRSQPLGNLLRQVAAELMLNELELIVWSIYLDKLVWTQRVPSVRNVLYFTAYTAKTYLNENEDSLIFQAFLASTIRSFIVLYNIWITKQQSKIAILPSELNCKYSELTKPLLSDRDKALDSNLYVDEILEHCDAEEPRLSLLGSRVSEPELPLFVKTNSLVCVRAKSLPPFKPPEPPSSDEELPVLKQADSMFSEFFNSQP